ncbi:MAG: 30S ribosomal protein S1 [Amoebophilaceae bacterium]|jgi:small subunit ribosomal protein S1|nr:30S ribosomal protein S1 [Amoebophilaceae bacterium]
MNPKAETSHWEPTGLTAGLGITYTDQERAALTQSYEATLTSIKACEVVNGTVVAISNREVIVNIGFKSDGLVPLNEFRDLPDLKPGDEVEVYIEEQENAEGQLVLSRKKAKLVRGWEKIQASADNSSVIEGVVKRRTKGGLIVDIYGIEAFLPGSQIDVRPVRDFDAYVDKSIDVAVVKINYANDNVVVSHKILIEKSLESQKDAIIGRLEKGQILEGVIKNMTSFGVFVDLGGVDGLLHITDISWGRIGHPEEVLELGQKVKVVVTDFDESKKRISLGMKQLTPHPWEALPDSIEVGSKLHGKVVNLADYGAFVEIVPGVEGLVHISEMSWSQYPRNIRDLIKVGDKIEAVVLTLDREERKMSLGLKQLTLDPWTSTDLSVRYAIGTKHQGTVRNMTHFGVFVELEEGIEGLLHVSDLSWTQKISHPSEILKVGDSVEAIVLELDQENRKLALGRKQLEENPWDTYETVFQVDSVHQGTMTQKVEKGALVALNHDVEGFVPKRHLIKEDGQEASVGELLELKVIEFSKANKRIVLSHTAVFSEVKERLDTSKAKSDKRAVASNSLTTAKKSTLGDIEALADLKERIEEGLENLQ